MKMVRTPISLSPNRSLVVLVVLLLALVGIAAARTFVGSSFQPAAPVYAPVENPASIAPAMEASSVPLPAAPVRGETAIPIRNTAAPAPASVYPAAPTTAPAAPVVPHPTVPVGPATTAAPGRDIPAIAPEPGMPGFNPPPGRD